jgi:hypothetical protein
MACGYIGWWMVSGVEALLGEMALNSQGVLVQDYTPQDLTLFTVARYAIIPLALMGFSVVVTGAAWHGSPGKQKLALLQTLAGLLIIAVSVFILLTGYAFDYIVAIEGGPVLEMATARNITMITGLFGLAVTVLSIFQLFRHRNTVITAKGAVTA